MSNIATRILKKIQASVAEAEKQIKLETAMLEDGTTIEADSFDVGMVAFVPVEGEDSIPVPAGTYTLDNGYTITTDENGVIVNVIETAAVTDPATPPSPDTTSTEASTAAAVAKKTIERKELETIFSASQEKMEKQIQEQIDSKILALSKTYDDKIEAMNVQLSEMKTENESLRIQLSESPAVAVLPRTMRTEIVKLSASEISQLSPSQRILYKTRNLSPKS